SRHAVPLERTAPTNEGPTGDRIGEEVLGVEANTAVVAAELRDERVADRLPAAALPAVELVVGGVVREERHHRVEVVAIERVGESEHELLELGPSHGGTRSHRLVSSPFSMSSGTYATQGRRA